MTSQQLYAILKLVDTLDQKLGIQTSLEAIRESLTNLVGSPAQPNYQSTLATSLAAFTSAVANMAASISPSQSDAIQEMGGAETLRSGYSRKGDYVHPNQCHDALRRPRFVQDMATRRAAFLATVRSARQALEKLKITDEGLKPGTADVAFHIPRDMFDNELGPFAKELAFISRLVQDFTEAQTGRPEPVILEQLSSSTPTIALIAALPALHVLGIVINKYLEAWERIEKIRIMRQQLSDMRLKKGQTALEELTEEITTTVNEVVEESTELVTKEYKGDRGDLANAVRSDTRRLFGQIERGLTVEFRAQPQGSNDENQQTLQQIAGLANQLKFPQITNEPLLLKAGEVLEDSDGGIHLKQERKAPDQKTSTSKTTKEVKASKEEG